MKTNGGVTTLWFIHKTHNERWKKKEKKLHRLNLRNIFQNSRITNFSMFIFQFSCKFYRFNFKTTINANTSFIHLSENNFPLHPLQLLAQCCSEHHSLLIFPSSWCMLIWVQHAICFMSLCAIHANFHSKEHLTEHLWRVCRWRKCKYYRNNIEFVNHVTCYHLKLKVFLITCAAGFAF